MQQQIADGHSFSLMSISPNDAEVLHAQSNSRPFRLLDLPAELRVCIYGHCLTVGKVFFKIAPWEPSLEGGVGLRFWKYERYEKPNVALLRTCRQIHYEAEDIYLSTNLFVLPPNFAHCQPFRDLVGSLSTINVRSLVPVGSMIERRPLFSPKGISLVRNVNVTFCPQVDTTYVGSTRFMWDWPPGYISVPVRRRRWRVHDDCVQSLLVQWAMMFQALRFLRNLRGHVELDYAKAFCPMGCCRLPLVDFDFFISDGPTPACVRVVNSTLSGRDFTDVRHVQHEVMSSWPMWMSVWQLKALPEVVFDGEDVWAQFIPRQT